MKIYKIIVLKEPKQDKSSIHFGWQEYVSKL